MKIALRMEGGAGDHVLAHRFAHAIHEKYPHAKFSLFSDTEGKTFQTQLLELLYPNFYEDIVIIPNKTRKPFKVRNQFNAEEDYPAHYDNIPEEYRKQIESHDRSYDLHIDSLKFTEYDFDWKRYFRFFPTPVAARQYEELEGDYIAVHLRSTSNRANDLQSWYIEGLLQRLVKTSKVKVIATEEDKPFYGTLPEGAEFVTGELPLIVSTIAHSKLFLSVDSGFTYVAYAYDIPTLTFNAFCRVPHQCAPHQVIRWTIFPERIIPLNYDSGWVASKAWQIIKCSGIGLMPQLDNFELQAVKRNNVIL